MLTYTLNLGQVEKLKAFVEFCKQFSFQINVIEARKAVNAKNLLKVLQLNLNNDVVIHAFVNDFSEAKVFNKKIREYI